jgi:TrwC relaxase
MHQGCVCSRQRRREGSGGVVADIAKLSVGREEYYTRELATDHEAYLSGHGESPGRWYGAGASSLGLQGEASPASFNGCSRAATPDTGGAPQNGIDHADGSCLRMTVRQAREPMTTGTCWRRVDARAQSTEHVGWPGRREVRRSDRVAEDRRQA